VGGGGGGWKEALAVRGARGVDRVRSRPVVVTMVAERCRQTEAATEKTLTYQGPQRSSRWLLQGVTHSDPWVSAMLGCQSTTHSPAWSYFRLKSVLCASTLGGECRKIHVHQLKRIKRSCSSHRKTQLVLTVTALHSARQIALSKTHVARRPGKKANSRANPLPWPQHRLQSPSLDGTCTRAGARPSCLSR